MADIIIPTGDDPTPSLRSAAVGASWGSILSTPAFLLGPVWGWGTQIASVLTGYLVGATAGQHKAQDEMNSGVKVVKEPTFWNGGLVRGAAAGVMITAIAQTAIGLISKHAALSSLHGLTALAPAVLGVTLPWLVVGAVALGAVAMIAGSISVKDRMQHEYAHAQAVQAAISQEAAISRARSLEQGYAQDIAPAAPAIDRNAPKPSIGQFTQNINMEAASSANKAPGIA